MGCETFSRSVDAVVAKNWLTRVFDTLNYMELDDELKLKVATRLIDKRATTWWDNLKLRVSTPIPGTCLFKNLISSSTPD